MAFLHKIHHYNRKGKLIETTPIRTIVSKGKPVLRIHLYRENNKFTTSDGVTPYPEELLPENVKKEFAYLFEKKADESKPIEEAKPEPEKSLEDALAEDIGGEDVSEKAPDKETVPV